MYTLPKGAVATANGQDASYLEVDYETGENLLPSTAPVEPVIRWVVTIVSRGVERECQSLADAMRFVAINYLKEVAVINVYEAGSTLLARYFYPANASNEKAQWFDAIHPKVDLSGQPRAIVKYGDKTKGTIRTATREQVMRNVES